MHPKQSIGKSYPTVTVLPRFSPFGLLLVSQVEIYFQRLPSSDNKRDLRKFPHYSVAAVQD